jgi:peptidoglycan/xylan/chitin deacetylase (PgdA/CDA1 family)
MTIGSHGLTHTALTRLGRPELMAELRNSRDLLEQIVGAPVSCLAIPGGFVNAGVLDAAREAGYAHVCTSVPGFARPQWLLPRFSITAATSKAALTSMARRNRRFFLKVRAAYAVRMVVKSLIGVARYEELYRILRQRPIMNR